LLSYFKSCLGRKRARYGHTKGGAAAKVQGKTARRGKYETVIKITEKKGERDKRLVNDCGFQGHLPSAGRWDEGNRPSAQAWSCGEMSLPLFSVGSSGFHS